jgi:hypothetical protein
MIDAVWKLIIFVSMLYRITKTSRNERVILRVYNTHPTSFRSVHPWSHGTYAGRSLIRKLQHTKRFLLRSRHFLFVTSRTEKGGEWDCACDQNVNTCCFVPCGKHTSACISKAVMAAWNRSNNFGTRCTKQAHVTSYSSLRSSDTISTTAKHLLTTKRNDGDVPVGFGFDYRPRGRLSWLNVFLVFLSPVSRILELL